MKEENNKIEWKDSFVAFIDILGFKKRFSRERENCIKLLSDFAKLNGKHSIKVDPETNTRTYRVALRCFSDNIGISMPIDVNNPKHINYLTETFFYTLSCIGNLALNSSFYIRGAIAFGEIYHSKTVIAGASFIEAVEHEKIAHYPRIILTPSGLRKIENLFQGNIYKSLCLVNDKVDNIIYFDWLKFYKNIHYQEQILNNLAGARESINRDISETSNLEILQKLHWMKNYIDNF